MSQEHLTYFKVENFKRFDALELTDIGQFNLIVGDNNVGKTSLLEALMFSLDRQEYLIRLHETLCKKGLHIHTEITYSKNGIISEVKYPQDNFLAYLLRTISEKMQINAIFESGRHEFISIKYVEYSNIITVSGLKDLYDSDIKFIGKSPDNRYVEFYWRTENSNEKTDFPIKGRTEVAGLYEHFYSHEVDMPLVTTSINEKNAFIDVYFSTINLSRTAKKDIIKNLKIILPDAEDFEVRKIGGVDQLMIGIKDKDELMPVSLFGESVIRTTQILLKISKNKGGRLMIDEIDTGIHHSRIKPFLKNVIILASQNNVQLFMTTHSLECQQAFSAIFEDDDMQEHALKVRQFTLFEDKHGKVVASKRNWQQLECALESGFETRGGV